jgi:ATP-dependent Lon protease
MELNRKSLLLPVICTRGIIFFPGIEMSIEVGRKKSLEAVEQARDIYDNYVIVTCQKRPEENDPQSDALYKVGTLCRIVSAKANRDHSQRVLIKGLERVEIAEFTNLYGTIFAKAKSVYDIYGDQSEETALKRVLINSKKDILKKLNVPAVVLNDYLVEERPASEIADYLASVISINFDLKQMILEELDINKRLQLLIDTIAKENLINEIEDSINKKVKSKIDENQKEYVLREKLRAIKEELGDSVNKDDDTENLRKTVLENPYPQNVKDKVLDELKRLDMMSPASPEASIIRTYLDWLIKVPWYQSTKDNEDISNVEKILNEDHYGLVKPKERIVEYLAVKQLTSSLKAPIICFSGPPGTGKTSLALSIARALGRKSVKVSLGGVRDESEIRGHRRTYIGSLPGRIIQGMKRAGSINPVFILDEIDKLGSDYKGDPSSALLEVLDPEQNKQFSDNYLEEPYDLSNVLFIATANYLENIPMPLRDRLEIIELSSYTEDEKLNIAKNHLIAKQVEQNGVKDLSFTNEAILCIIRNYTREAGVRQLERHIGSIARKVAVKTLKQGRVSHKINENGVKRYLGKELYDYTKKEKKDQVGVAMGLAYTQYGGDILPIEVAYFEGKGHVTVTGNLGDVMKESANIAVGHVKANAKQYGVEPKVFEGIDLHIHAPEGAVPKDGPSAGVTMTTAIVSALSKHPVRSDIAMTGEVTLRGNILPIGGLREKSIAAHRSGIMTIFIPKENEKDIEDIPATVKKDMKIIPVSHVSEIIHQVIL